jgi:hypothetical protein
MAVDAADPAQVLTRKRAVGVQHTKPAGGGAQPEVPLGVVGERDDVLAELQRELIERQHIACPNLRHPQVDVAEPHTDPVWTREKMRGNRARGTTSGEKGSLAKRAIPRSVDTHSTPRRSTWVARTTDPGSPSASP